MAIDKLFQKKNTLKGNLNALRQYKQTITLSQIQREVLVGTLLGDACLYLSKGKPRLSVQFEQTIARSEYIWHLYSVFENFVGTPPRVKKNRGGAKARDYQSICFQTFGLCPLRGHPIFYPAHEYKGLRRKKRVPENINDLLTPRALAYWFMDDGSYTSDKNRTYRFSTQSFPFEDQERLLEALKNNFDIDATIQKDRSHYILYIRSKSTKRFVDLIRPYIHPCFSSKIQNNKSLL